MARKMVDGDVLLEHAEMVCARYSDVQLMPELSLTDRERAYVEAFQREAIEKIMLRAGEEVRALDLFVTVLRARRKEREAYMLARPLSPRDLREVIDHLLIIIPMSFRSLRKQLLDLHVEVEFGVAKTEVKYWQRAAELLNQHYGFMPEHEKHATWVKEAQLIFKEAGKSFDAA